MYALTLNTTAVLGVRSLSVCCVADVLNDPLLFETISYKILRPDGANEGGFHEIELLN